MAVESGETTPITVRRWVALFVGPALATVTYALLPRATYDATGNVASGLPPDGRVVAGVGLLMATWWLTEAIPIPATALLPIALPALLTRGRISIVEPTATVVMKLPNRRRSARRRCSGTHRGDPAPAWIRGAAHIG
jgi:sodium-dependent dicarboxylate transporter 2/3/5